MFTDAFFPQYMYYPEYIPSTATKCSLTVLNEYGSLNATTHTGAPLPGSWIISFTTPLTYPYFSE